MSEKSRSRRHRGGSRKAMQARRSKPPEINPAPAGPKGGQYRPLTDSQVEQIYNTSLRMLAELGMGDSPAALTERALECGATINELGRLCFSATWSKTSSRAPASRSYFTGATIDTALKSAGTGCTSALVAPRCRRWISIRTFIARQPCAI